MGELIGSIFGLAKPEAAKAQGPSAEELAAQKEQQDLTDRKTSIQAGERAARNKIITARAAGPQTLFTRPGSIPKPRRLGGGTSA